jgi:hypothetical protein
MWTGIGAAFAGVSLAAGAVVAAFHGRGFVMTALFVVAFLGLELVYQGSFNVWRSHFEAGSVVNLDGFDARRWHATFERCPFAIRIFEAKRFVESRQNPSRVVDCDGSATVAKDVPIGTVEDQP